MKRRQDPYVLLATTLLVISLLQCMAHPAQQPRPVELDDLAAHLYRPVDAGLRDMSFIFRHGGFENAAYPFRATRFEVSFVAPDRWDLRVTGLHESHRLMAPRLEKLVGWVRLVTGGMEILDVGLDPHRVAKVESSGDRVRVETEPTMDGGPWTLEFGSLDGRANAFYLLRAESRETGALTLHYETAKSIEIVTSIDVDHPQSALGPWTLRLNDIRVNASDPSEDADEPGLRDRAPFPIPPGYGKDHPVWRRPHDSAWELAGVRPETLGDIVGWVGPHPIRYRDVVEEAVLRFGAGHAKEFMNDLIFLAEIEGTGTEVTEEEMRRGLEEFREMLRARGVHGKATLREEMRWSEELLRLKVFLNEGGKKILARDHGGTINPNDEAFLLQVWASEVIERYPVRGSFTDSVAIEPGRAPLVVGNRPIHVMEIAPRLLPNLTSRHFREAFQGVVESILVREELARLGVSVTDEELEERIARERQRYEGGLFDWKTMVEISGRSLPLERRTLRTWLAYDKVVGVPTDEQLRAHFRESPVYFGRGAVAACEIETRFEAKGGRAVALERIEAAARELENGTPFEDVVARYSDDPDSKRASKATLFNGKSRDIAGAIGIFPIRNGRMENEIAAAVFPLAKGDWIGPIEGPEGYHLVYVLDSKPPRNLPFDEEAFEDRNGNGRYDQGEPFDDSTGDGRWNDGQRSNVRDDFESERVGHWIDGLVRRAWIERHREGW